MPEYAESDLAALERFVIENDDLLELEATIGRFNIFDALRIERTEIRHSNFLAWLLTPSESHGQGDLFLKAVLMDVLRTAPRRLRPLSPVALDGEELHDVEVRREHKHIDLLVICKHPRLVVVIENKVDSEEHSDQLTRYDGLAAGEFAQEPTLLVFLTPEGRSPSSDRWVPYSYGNLHRVLSRIQRSAGGSLGGDVDVFLRHYLLLIGSRLMDDPKLDELCARIYANHRRAIDLIIARVPAAGSGVGASVRSWVDAHRESWVARGTRGQQYIQVIPACWIGTFSTPDAQRSPTAPCDVFIEFEAGRTFLAARIVVGPGEQKARVALIERITAATPLRTPRREISTTWTRMGSKTLLKWSDGSEPEEDVVEKAVAAYLGGLEPSLRVFPDLLPGVGGP